MSKRSFVAMKMREGIKIQEAPKWGNFEPVEIKLEKVYDSDKALCELLRAVCEGYPWVWVDPIFIISAPPDDPPRLVMVGNQPWNPKYNRLVVQLFKQDRDW